MPQMSIYFDQGLETRVRRAAESKAVSVSKYISDVLREDLDSGWSPEFLDALGALGNFDMRRPEQPMIADDSKREKM